MEQIKFPKFKDYKNQPVRYIQPKLDGHLTKIYKNCDDWFAYTKNDKEITGKLLRIEHISEQLQNLPNNSIVFAELHCPGVLATSVPTMLNAADEKLRLTAFAVPLLNGIDNSHSDLSELMLKLHIVYGLDATHADCQLLQGITEKYKAELLAKAVERKWEGWVLKAEHMKGWYKLKPVKTLDAFVIGVYQSFSSTHYGGLQSIHVAVKNEAGKTHDLGQIGSGFELEYRKQFDTKEKRDFLIGKVCEVRYDSIAANGKLRFPRFVRWRDDKDAKDCLMDESEL